MEESQQTVFDKGTVIADRYIIQEKIGCGGMGAVFLALDSEKGQRVALKTLPEQFLDNKYAVSRFIREINTLRMLGHPGIVKLRDAQMANNTLFYVMEYVEGKSLRHLLQVRKRFEFPTTVRLLCLVADALSHAHKITIHRDLSPENIMVLRDGSIRLLDFGLAKLADKFKDLTATGINLGKLQYMAPEQKRSAARVDARADLYSLGVIFFELLTGHLPEPGQSLIVIRPDLPSKTNVFFLRAVAPEPEKRFQSATEFRDTLLALYKET